jgi:RNA polymerase sigma factor (sigma-70 family)
MITAMDEDDLALLHRWCAGDEAAGNALFKRHFESVFRFFEHKVDSEADELVQETFLACLRDRDQFRRQSSFRTYLFAIARHLLYAYWRKRSTRPASLDFDEVTIASLSTSAGSRLAGGEDRGRLLTALGELPVEQQLLLELHYWEELDRDQLAEVFDVAQATTRSRLFRARQALRERLADAAGDPARARTDDALDDWARSLRAEAHGGEPE